MTEWREKRQTMHHYDQSAPVYDTQYHDEQEAKIRTALTEFTLEKENLTLDAGCGTGLLFSHIVGKVKLVVGLDFSSLILKQTEKKRKAQPNIAIVRADIDNAPFKNDIFDTVFAITLLQNTPKPHQTLKELKRVTNKDATIVATGLKKAFSQKKFAQLLKGAKLQIKVLRPDENFRENVAICTKPSKKTLKEP